MSTLLERLTRVTQTLLDVERPAYSLRAEVLDLKAIFEEASGRRFDGAAGDIAAGETITAAGVAISPTMASMCVDDFSRTVQFLRGTHDAIADLPARINDRPVRVLYAGCGPWATLATPLMTVFPLGEVLFTLLDIHDESIALARKTIDAFRLTDGVDRFVVDDALNYRIDLEVRPNIIVIEMLRAALEGEPQVAASMNLLRQVPTAVVVPEEVQVELALVNRAREFSFEGEEGDRERDRVAVGTVLTLNKDLVLTPRPALVSSVELPSYDRSLYTPMLLTTIRIYGEHVLSDYDSGITCPKALPQDAGPGEMIEIRYEIEGGPGFRVVRSSDLNA